ncbi:MAG TPA: undecaprenyldiphospho-muramoylpentapeptide beta-N-acetylglucosaminyltransferase [Saprospiraceae bacterium]|nr:undecaprenyldiphospho-muramoylpentapeptide beta-N-acetylglucosaminyltransferase [Saprospiraceae bacterium]
MKRVIISGGGTGGHIYPAIAIADAVKAALDNVELLFVGAEGKMEMEKVPKAGYRIIGLPVAGFQRRLTLKNLMFPFKLIRSMARSKKVVRDFKPDIAIGVGGYASGPVLRVASGSAIPTVIQEQNSYPGVTNKILAKRASAICVAYEGMERFFPADKIHLTGNPVRRDIADLKDKRDEGIRFYHLDPAKKTILVMGGSLGARTLNEALAAATQMIAGNEDIQWIWQSGSFYKGMYDDSPLAKLSNVRNLAFIERMDLAYACADLVIGRAGALTISEICIAGKPSILVPSPNVAEDHQTKNAMALVEKDATILVKDDDAMNELVSQSIALVRNEERMQQLGAHARSMGKPNAADDIARVIIEILNRNAL